MPTPLGATPDNTEPPATGSVPARPRVRRALVSDAFRLAEINISTWRHAYVGIVPRSYLEILDQDRFRDRWVARITDPGERFTLVAEVEGLVAAYAMGGPYRTQHDAEPEDTAAWGELDAIYAHPQMQRRGAGLAVHDATLEALCRQGFAVVALWVLRDNVLGRRWYDGRGWGADGATSAWLGAGVPLEEVRLTRALGMRDGVVPAAATTR